MNKAVVADLGTVRQCSEEAIPHHLTKAQTKAKLEMLCKNMDEEMGTTMTASMTMTSGMLFGSIKTTMVGTPLFMVSSWCVCVCVCRALACSSCVWLYNLLFIEF